MPSHSRFLEALRACGYSYAKKETSRTRLYKKKRGSQDTVFVPKNKALSDDFVRSVLQREGYSPEQIARLLQES